MSSPNRSRLPGANIFVIHTAFQRLITDHMVRSMESLADHDNHLVFDCQTGDESLSDNWKSVVRLRNPVGGSVVGSGQRCRQALSTISAIMAEYTNVELLVSDINWPLNNALFGLVRKQRGLDQAISICTFPDGLGSLMLAYPNRYQQIKNIMKASLSFLGGLPYYLHRGDKMGLEISGKIYSLMPSVLPLSIQSRAIPIPMIKPLVDNFNAEACLFVGQNHDAFMSENNYREMCLRAAGFTLDLGYQDLLYKPHPFATSKVELETFSRSGFEVVTDNRAVEEMFLTKQVACVVSYNSSALVHLRMMFGDRVRCISCCGRRAIEAAPVRLSAVREMLNLFERCGVECHE